MTKIDNRFEKGQLHPGHVSGEEQESKVQQSLPEPPAGLPADLPLEDDNGGCPLCHGDHAEENHVPEDHD